MMQDAKDRRFDLIVTRKISRFARNTIDTQKSLRLMAWKCSLQKTISGHWTMTTESLNYQSWLLWLRIKVRRSHSVLKLVKRFRLRMVSFNEAILSIRYLLGYLIFFYRKIIFISQPWEHDINIFWMYSTKIWGKSSVFPNWEEGLKYPNLRQKDWRSSC